MNFKTTSLALILLAPIPFYISVFQLINNGGIQWPMIWANELTFWGLVFSVFAFAGVIAAYRKRKNQQIFMRISIVVAILALTPMTVNLINQGFGQSSKADSVSLEPMAFWSSGWWK